MASKDVLAGLSQRGISVDGRGDEAVQVNPV